MNQQDKQTVDNIRKAIAAALKAERLTPYEGIKLLSIAFLQIVMGTGHLQGQNPKLFAFSILGNMEKLLNQQQAPAAK